MNTLPKGYEAAARQHESTCDCCGPDLAERADEILADYLTDDAKVLEACEHVFGFMDYDPAPDLAACMIGHGDDQQARDIRFARELRQKVEDRLWEMAGEAAESERLEAEEAAGEDEYVEGAS